MRSMPVVLVVPRSEIAEALGGVLIEPGVGPFADGGLDEAFGFAVGARGVEARAPGFDAQPAAVGGEATRTEARAVIGQHAAHGNAQAREEGHRLAQKFAGGQGFFVRQQGSEGDAGVIVDSDIKKFPTGAAGFVLRIAGEAMAGFGNTGQLFDVDVQQIAGSRMLIANDGNGGLARASGVQLQASEDAADGGAAQTGGLRDAHAGPTFAAQHFHATGQLGGSAAGRALRARGTVLQSGRAALAKAADPLGGRLPAELELGCSRVQTPSPAKTFFASSSRL